jgi:hypothetical protein
LRVLKESEEDLVSDVAEEIAQGGVKGVAGLVSDIQTFQGRRSSWWRVVAISL